MAQYLVEHDKRISWKPIDLLRTGGSFIDIFGENDSHTILLLLPTFLENSLEKYKYISMTCYRRIATLAIGVKLGPLAAQDATYKGRKVYNCMLQNSYFCFGRRVGF